MNNLFICHLQMIGQVLSMDRYAGMHTTYLYISYEHGSFHSNIFLKLLPQNVKMEPAKSPISLRKIPLGLHSERYLNFRKAATCSHSQPLEWPQVAALSGGRK